MKESGEILIITNGLWATDKVQRILIIGTSGRSIPLQKTQVRGAKSTRGTRERGEKRAKTDLVNILYGKGPRTTNDQGDGFSWELLKDRGGERERGE